MGLKYGTVCLEKYNSNWKIEFEREKEILRGIFGDYAICIEHVGSTSIPGLSAKPIIDIAVGVNDLRDVLFVEKLFSTHSNYLVKKDSVEGEILVVKSLDDDYTTHLIHVMELDGNRYDDTILFRNYLIQNKYILNKYENLKIELAAKCVNNLKMYTSSKNEFISEILNQARSDG